MTPVHVMTEIYNINISIQTRRYLFDYKSIVGDAVVWCIDDRMVLQIVRVKVLKCRSRGESLPSLLLNNVPWCEGLQKTLEWSYGWQWWSRTWWWWFGLIMMNVSYFVTILGTARDEREQCDDSAELVLGRCYCPIGLLCDIRRSTKWTHTARGQSMGMQIFVNVSWMRFPSATEDLVNTHHNNRSSDRLLVDVELRYVPHLL